MVYTFWLPLLLAAPPAGTPGPAPPRLPVLANGEAWKRLPGAAGDPQVLPAWARMLAGPLPLTTARMLELDALHRSGDRLDARLRCLARWAAADANRCEYVKAIATADFRRARNADGDLGQLAGAPDRLPALDRAVVAFARKMMTAAHTVTDAEVRRLIDLAGEERVVALVALLAHASFQDRIFLALRPPADPDGGVPPLAGRFARPAPAAASRKTPPERQPGPRGSATPEWLALQDKLDRQRGRTGRIRMPTTAEVLARIGEKHPAAWQAGILWSRVCYGYQPELTDAWFDAAGAFRVEAKLDPVFQNSVFWIVTRSLDCFY